MAALAGAAATLALVVALTADRLAKTPGELLMSGWRPGDPEIGVVFCREGQEGCSTTSDAHRDAAWEAMEKTAGVGSISGAGTHGPGRDLQADGLLVRLAPGADRVAVMKAADALPGILEVVDRTCVDRGVWARLTGARCGFAD
ncbi:hypothetical protein [Nonomuraea typhae]|uniref:hypothetical protein n=1 Tax=Nonomuraea typhae TaxID=2603600 RepID=UPI0012FB712B|nr:hypothetical protein [Nonomuraea typhae]